MTRSSDTDRRHARDRRRFARGGRRPTDKDGYAPLVLVVDEDVDSNTHCEAILASLRFAVAPAHSIDEAVRVMHGLRPNVVVSHLKDTQRLRDEMRDDARTRDVPLIAIDEVTVDPAALVEEIRRVLRERNTLAYPGAAATEAARSRTGSG